MTDVHQDKYALASQEDRSGLRNRTSIPASLRPSGSRSFQTVVRNLSVSGFSATAISFIHPGTQVWLTLPGLQSQPARVVWWDDGLAGCAFNDLLSPIVLDEILNRWDDRRGSPGIR